MKRILIAIMMIMILTGCSSQTNETTYMLTHDELFALYNQDGKRLTNYLYTSYEEIEGVGYIVFDQNNQPGLISLKGEQVIPFGEYETLEATDQMLYATKKVEEKTKDEKTKNKKTKDTKTKDKKTEDKNQNEFLKTNLYVLNGKGEVLYSADEHTGIMKSGLPVIQKDDSYIVLYRDGQEFYNGQEVVKYASQYDHSSYVIVGYDGYFHLTKIAENKDEEDIKIGMEQGGNYSIIAAHEKALLLNDKTLKSIIYIDMTTQETYQHNIYIQEAQFDEDGNLYLKDGQHTYIYRVEETPIKMNTYFLSPNSYVIRSSDIYGPHIVYNEGKEVASLENCQFYPAAKKIEYEIYPVYIRDQGYQYYNFKGKKVIDQTYIYAEPFDAPHTAIVKISDKGYSLIDASGHVLTKQEYHRIKYMNSSYYAVYNESGQFGIIDKNGQEVFPMEYTAEANVTVLSTLNYNYILLIKNGRSYVYDMDDKKKEILSQEGNIEYNEKGYFKIGDSYYNLDCEKIE